MATDFPKTLYRDTPQGRTGKTFAREEDVEPGWSCIDDLPPAPMPSAAPALDAPQEGVIVDHGELDRLRDSVAMLERERDAARASRDAMLGFVRSITDAAPEDFDAIQQAAKELTSGDGAEKPAAKTKGKGKAKAA